VSNFFAIVRHFGEDAISMSVVLPNEHDSCFVVAPSKARNGHKAFREPKSVKRIT